MKRVHFVAFFCLITFPVFSQDLIIRTNGEEIYCKINSVDSLYVHFTFLKNEREITTNMRMTQVKKIVYEGQLASENIKPDSILIRKVNGSYKYYLDVVPLKDHELVGLISLNAKAYNKYKLSRENSTFAFILGFAGGFAIGYELGAFITGKEPNWYVAGAGAGLILLSIPASISAREHLHGAIDLYNQGLNTSSLEKPKVYFAFTGSGIGFIVNF